MGDPRYFSSAVKTRWLNTFFNQKPLYRLILTLFVGLAMWLVPFSVKGATIFEDNFNSYDEGDLTGQGNWLENATQNSFQVISSPTYEGARAIKSTTAVIFGNHKLGSEEASGTLSVALKFVSGELGSNISFIANNPGESFSAGFWVIKNADSLDITTFELTCGSFSLDDWHILRFEWWQIGNSTQADFYVDSIFCRTKQIAGYADVLDRIKFYSVNSEFLLDFISETGTGACRLGSCENCETYESCISGGCFWEHSAWPLIVEDACFEPSEPNPEYCGGFFECQYCLDETTCETNSTCVWQDIGFGNKCYMISPVIPPAQAGWEAPELEDCEALSGVEKWLCEIKNFIAGIFMPTQEKVEEFYLTIGAFSERFPFNYAQSLRSFFTDIKTGFDTEKSIPVKILGEEGDVDFTFWSASTTIGGTAENLGNIVKDFSTFIIILAFSMWLIGFIKRIL